jgi:hypothetical protein
MNVRAIAPLRALATFSFGVLAVMAAACTTNVTNNPADSSGGGSSPVPTADCKSRCEAKASECGAPAAKAQEGCVAVCDGSYTGDQLSCLEGKACSELQTTSLSGVCPPASGTTSGGTTSGGTTSGGGGDTHFSCSLNGQCFKCKDSAGVSKCSISTGPGPGCTSTDDSYCQ